MKPAGIEAAGARQPHSFSGFFGSKEERERGRGSVIFDARGSFCEARNFVLARVHMVNRDIEEICSIYFTISRTRSRIYFEF